LRNGCTYREDASKYDEHHSPWPSLEYQQQTSYKGNGKRDQCN